MRWRAGVAELGFYDQAHPANSLRRFIGFSATALVDPGGRIPMSFLCKTDAQLPSWSPPRHERSWRNQPQGGLMLLSVNTFSSLDGVMQGPGAPDEDTSDGFERGGWLVPLVREEPDAVVDDWFRQAEAILLGRRTFQMMRAYWSQVTNPDDLVATALNT